MEYLNRLIIITKKKISRSNNDIHTLSSLLIRKSKGITKFEYSTINFVDTLIMREFGSKDRRLKKSFFYEEVLKSIHNKLDNYWIDFDKCDNGIPHDLIDSLLDPKKPKLKVNNSE